MSAHFDPIKSMLDRFCAAWKTSDGASVAGFFVGDGVLINPFGGRGDGRSAIAAMYSQYFGGMLRGTTTTVQLGSVRNVEKDHAFADADQTIYAADGSVVMVVHLAALLRREADGWRFADARPYAFSAAPE